MSTELTPDELAEKLRSLSDALDNLAQLIQAQKHSSFSRDPSPVKLTARKLKAHAYTLDETTCREHLKKCYRRNFLIGYLQQRKIRVKTYVSSLKTDEYIIDAARFLAEHYHNLSPFYKALKLSTYQKKDFTFPVSSAASNRFITAWCERMRRIKYIDSYELCDSGAVEVDISNLSEAGFFIYGTWLEVLLRNHVAYFLKQNYARIKSFDVLSRIVVINKKGRIITEYDLLLMINEALYYIECKSKMGDSNKDYQKFKNNIHRLGIQPAHSALLIPEPNQQWSANLTTQCGMLSLHATDLEKELTDFLKL